MTISNFSETVVRQIGNVLESAASHRELTALFSECKIVEQGGNPKWERITLALIARQRQDNCGNNVVAFIQAAMNPVRFVGQTSRFEELRHHLNEVISFAGLQLGDDGTVGTATTARTLSEAAERAGRLRKLLQQRQVHSDVRLFCREELLKDNYFHAVFEATKSVADKIRSKSGLLSDGAELVDGAFSIKNPMLVINTLRTETEQSEHKGFANLLKGVFGTFRNVTAHAPKIHWTIEEQDALDLLTMVSYLHRRLDRAVKVPHHSGVAT
ncbi:MAG: TIGR02391 family protein [Verrucomicrobia subdivision 3 bacterium]|nr:TIGR02391 family protein [Limisphaerales bacterium]